MEKIYEIIYQAEVVSVDIEKLGAKEASDIQRAINKKLVVHPEIFGVPLREDLKGLRKLRVGNFRVIFSLQGEKVLVFVIGHRSKVYKILKNRIKNAHY